MDAWDDMSGTLRRVERQVEDARNHLITVEALVREYAPYLVNLKLLTNLIFYFATGWTALLALTLWRVW